MALAKLWTEQSSNEDTRQHSREGRAASGAPAKKIGRSISGSWQRFTPVFTTSAAFEEVRCVLEREGLIEANLMINGPPPVRAVPHKTGCRRCASSSARLEPGR